MGANVVVVPRAWAYVVPISCALAVVLIVNVVLKRKVCFHTIASTDSSSLPLVPATSKQLSNNYLSSATFAHVLSVANAQRAVIWSDYNRPWINEDDRLLFCFIAKNSCSRLKELFARMNMHNEHQSELEFGLLARSIKPNKDARVTRQVQDVQHYESIVRSSDWKKFVLVRDPLERLLSGYDDKCMNHRFSSMCFPSNHTPEFVREARVYNHSLFAYFVQGLADSLQRGIKVDEHFLPQFLWCDLFKHIHEYDFVYQYHRDSIGDNVLEMLKATNLTQFFYGWGKFRNESLFFAVVDHATGAKTKSYLKEVYTPETAHLAYQIFAMDYMLLNIAYPSWIDDHISTWGSISNS
mmetsp:Transcript_45872/g.109227  ORF Transcript_45872/g.109227 Transcript_45872/m.109227 type:complete len:353 (-) Transcript_45872:175-1233(-)